MRTMAEMARGRGAVNEAIFYSEMAEAADRVRRISKFPVFVTPVMSSDSPDEWQVQCVVKKQIIHEYETVLEVIEPRDVFPSDFLIAQILLVS